MFWLEKIRTTDLKPFAQELIKNRSETIWTLEQAENGAEKITWPSYELDALMVVHLLKFLKTTANLDDKTFFPKHSKYIDWLLKTSPLFQRLDSEDIVVTKGHVGITPYRHTMRVFESLDTSTLTQDERVIIRFVAPFHDVGKAVSAGIGKQVYELMEVFKHPKHSHPSHAEISALVVMELLEHEKVKEEFYKIQPYAADQAVKLIINHHIFEDLQDKIPKRPHKNHEQRVLPAEVKEEFGTFTTDTWLLVMLTFLFSRADIGSNTSYHIYWRDKNWMMVQLLQTFWDGLDCDVKKSALKKLKLPKKLTVVDA